MICPNKQTDVFKILACGEVESGKYRGVVGGALTSARGDVGVPVAGEEGAGLDLGRPVIQVYGGCRGNAQSIITLHTGANEIRYTAVDQNPYILNG